MQTADLVLIPLLDGQHALAQIARVENGLALLFFTDQVATPRSTPRALADDDVIAALCVQVADLPSDIWPIIGYEAVPRIAPYHDTALDLFDTVDATHIEAFVNAVQGLYPWDGFPDPDYFTLMLRDENALPVRARKTADFPKPESS
ncbi:hypothetical protein Q4555_01795 [Octadecabacter sp. 1_MG-2023]|uniref:hypothetical protein n=1 Tax=unclassified Octadecabacter TaxID=196158 RepID=UPI001C0898D7|nr:MULTISPECIES: hypothetical protein [unclassified Octadecabacter]MBU2993166.1 hypothetical protein [Octadecabacter sp. B2R22]MDO6733382.1 hypothetical protein [Octadecabacter sp. 1_MG-2023]